jgi:hypothetical protein
MISKSGARHRQPHQQLHSLWIVLALLAVGRQGNAQPCPSDPPAVNTSTAHSSSTHSAIRTTFDRAGEVAQFACHRAAPSLALDVHHLSLAAASLVTARQSRTEMDSRAEQGEAQGSVGPQLNVPWRNVPGPAWVGNVPDWVTETARNYRHRGLPLVDLWQSSHYMVALGLSNHGVPGVYFTQKLP